MKKKCKQNRGITLIALIITIIVMLILVAVSVNILIKSNLIGTAEKTADKYKTATEEEKNGAIEINGKKYSSLTEYVKILNNNGSKIEFDYTIDNDELLKLNVYLIGSYEEFACEKLKGKSNSEKAEIITNGLAFWNGKGRALEKNIEEVLENTPFNNAEELVENLGDEPFIRQRLVYPEDWIFSKENDFLAFERAILENVTDEKDKEDFLLNGTNYWQSFEGGEPYEDITALLTDRGVATIEALYESQGFESLEDMLVFNQLIYPERLEEFEPTIELILPDGTILNNNGAIYCLPYPVDIFNEYVFTANCGNDKNTITIKIEEKPIEGPSINAGEIAEVNSIYKGVVIPAGFTVSGRTDEQNVEDGLVIYEIPKDDLDKAGENFWTETTTVGTENYPKVQCDYNQFVWVPVETPYVTANALTTIINNSNGTITTEQEALQSLADSGKYPMAVKAGSNYSGVMYSLREENSKVKVKVTTYFREPSTLSFTGYINSDKENNLMIQTRYNNIVKSVSKIKGFWVARYELSFNSEISKGESKRGKVVASGADETTKYWYGLYDVSELMYQNNETVQSSMIFGSQWYQILIWLKDLKNVVYPTKYYVGYGNGMGNLTFGGGVNAQVSGYNDNYSTKKIFDLLGNLGDWTAASEDTAYRVCFGWPSSAQAISASVQSTVEYHPIATPDNATTRVVLYMNNF